ncbi:D(4) dopamine receptor-like isoform X2 [Syngnathoides biaculeatus]|uniref:D(4) dopamine receptor-like isoform X2 n=1 Tax=Syngnathoides biaculeatus TaxID=300417 RepID=UPI002ADD9C03|nr:D(4) dopamine receptor-like isoform X2 [Syngnathoides biaculeatus]
MGTPATAPLGGFGATATAAAGWTYWSGNGLPKLNHSLARVAGGDGGVVPAAGGNVGNLTREVKNWPALLILVIIALTVGGNILVILAVSLEKKLQNATNFFLRSLAVADMLVGILVMPVSLINILYDYAWPLPSALCPIWIYLDVLFSTASIMHLCAISLDRYVAIRNPIEHSRFNSRTKAMMKIAAVWTISIGVSTPIPVIGLLNEDNVFVNGSCVLNEERFILMGSFVAFFIPLVIMVVTYGLTVQVLQRQATVFLCEANASSQQPLQAPAVTDASQKHPDLPGRKRKTSKMAASALNRAQGGVGVRHPPRCLRVRERRHPSRLGGDVAAELSGGRTRTRCRRRLPRTTGNDAGHQKRETGLQGVGNCLLSLPRHVVSLFHHQCHLGTVRRLLQRVSAPRAAQRLRVGGIHLVGRQPAGVHALQQDLQESLLQLHPLSLQRGRRCARGQPGLQEPDGASVVLARRHPPAGGGTQEGLRRPGTPQ